MNGRDDRKDTQGVPSYQAAPDTAWYHFLHGNVPNHQIDFIYRPEIPHGRLTRQHFSHLARLLSYIEPERRDIPAFAIGNLSRDDTQHEPGHGAVAILFAMRIRGATDHAGRPDPPYSHAIAAVDRELDKDVLLASSLALYDHVRLEPAGQGFYPHYVHTATADPPALGAALDAHVAGFSNLPRPATSTQSLRWSSGGASQSRRIVIVRPDECSFEQIAQCAAQIAAVLYRSDIRWTAITSGRELEIPNGVSIRLVAHKDVCHVASDALILPMDRVPADDDELALQLFGAKPLQPPSRVDQPDGTPFSAPVPLPPPVARAPSPHTIESAIPAEAFPVHTRPRRLAGIGVGIACILLTVVGAYQALMHEPSPGHVPRAMSLPRRMGTHPVPTGAPVEKPRPQPVPIAPPSTPASPLPAPARRFSFPAQAPAPRPPIEKAAQEKSTAGREQPVPRERATSGRAPEAPPFSTLDNEPVDR